MLSLICLKLGWIEVDNNVPLLTPNSSEMNYFSNTQWPQLIVDVWCPVGEYFNLDYKDNETGLI